MNERLDEFERLGAKVIVVSFSEPDRLVGHRAFLDLRFPVASDVERTAYRDFGLLSGSFFQVWHPRVILRYLRLTIRGLRPRVPDRDSDLAQLGGDFVIGPDGAVLYAFTSIRPDLRPSVEDLLGALSALRG